jgi:anti-sigma factor RsiW
MTHFSDVGAHGTCEGAAPLITRAADGDLRPDETAALDRHLAACPACRATAARERSVRQLLRARALELRETAPPGLAARVRARGRVAVFVPRRARSGRPFWQLPLAAMLLLSLVGGGLVALLAPSGTLLAAELALDHAKCQWLSKGKAHGAPASAQAEWAATQGWRITVPPGAPEEELEFNGARRCLFHGGSMAHLMYRDHGAPVSLFILPEPRQVPPAVAIMGAEMVTWSAGGQTLALVGGRSREELADLARRFARHGR